MIKLWQKLFLEERPAIGLSFFRIFAALTAGFHVIPSFFHLDDNFYSTALKSFNYSFFTPDAVALVQKSPDSVVLFFVILFLVSWFFFLIGLFSQISCIVMVACCYYFYALNCLHIGTLSWDILLVTLFLMCITNYHGDYFSVDALRRGDAEAYKKKRPFFIQQLLKMQIAFNYFYTGFYKITAEGNWLSGNPIYYLMNYPPEGVVKQFIFRGFFAARPELCYGAGILIVASELSMPFLLLWRRTKIFAIVYGAFFHVVLVSTFHVPTIFLFLFPPQLLLWLDPDKIAAWIEKKRESRGQSPAAKHGGGLPPGAQIIYDGHCGFCKWSLRMILVMDMFGYLKPVDYNQFEDPKLLHPNLTKEFCRSQLHLIEPDGRLYGGFFVFRRLSFKIPMLYPFIVLFYFPGSSFIGPMVYRWVAKNRYLFHFNRTCKDNACFRHPPADT